MLSVPAPAALFDRDPPTAHTRTGLFRSHPDFASQQLKPRRNVLVYLPPGYDAQPERRYPVLYLHDGQNLFDGATSFIKGQEWRADETAERLIAARMVEPVILVGIYNTGSTRLNEYTPTRDRMGRGGDGDLYVRFLVEELKPFIDKTYRTKPDAANTGVGGSSLGGLISLYAGLTHPEVFGKLAILSPSVWWDEQAILKRVKGLPRRPTMKIWVDIGTGEGYSALPDARLLRDALVAKGWTEGKDLKYVEAEGAQHNEIAWAARFDQVLTFLFPAK